MALDLNGDLVTLFTQIVDVESVSGNERQLADLVEESLRALPHVRVDRDGDAVIARTTLGRPARVVIAGHLDTVPVAHNLPSQLIDGRLYGRGTADMKGGVAVQLAAAAALTEPRHDVTWIFYDNEEVEADKNGLGRVARNHPDWLAGSFAVLMEPTSAGIEGGCQGTLRFDVTTTGQAAHSARAWLGHNAIHDAGALLQMLTRYEPARIIVDGLEYREGLNTVGISGGIAGNVIPDRCTISVNYRFAPDKTLAQAQDHCRDLFAGHELTFTDGAGGARPGLDLPAARDFMDAVGGDARPKYGWTDVARFAALGMAAVNFGPGDPGKAHTDDEFCPVEELFTCRDALLRWLA